MRSKAKERDNDFYEYSPLANDIFTSSLNNLDDISKPNFLAGNYTAGSFVSKEFVGGLNVEGPEFEKEQDLSELAGNFTASESIYAGYAMIEQNLGKKLLVLVGVRAEQTSLNYKGFQYNDEEGTIEPTENAQSSYLNLLPALHLKYNVSNSTIVYDIEGLSIYKDGNEGYLIASSQGNFSYAVFNRTGNNDFITSFKISTSPQIDGVEETDGLDIVSDSLSPQFPKGIIVLQDGFNHDGDSLVAQNFKFVDWRWMSQVLVK